MSAPSAPSVTWPSDLTGVCERLAMHLDRSGATHPVAAAVALAARGHHGLDLADFAAELGLPVEAVQRAEAGDIAWEELPDIIGHLLEAMANIDLLALADLETDYRHTS